MQQTLKGLTAQFPTGCPACPLLSQVLGPAPVKPQRPPPTTSPKKVLPPAGPGNLNLSGTNYLRENLVPPVPLPLAGAQTQCPQLSPCCLHQEQLL